MLQNRHLCVKKDCGENVWDGFNYAINVLIISPSIMFDEINIIIISSVISNQVCDVCYSPFKIVVINIIFSPVLSPALHC